MRVGAIIIALLIIVGGAYWFTKPDSLRAPTPVETPSAIETPKPQNTEIPTSKALPPETPSTSAPLPPTPAPGTFTMASVTTHSSADSCWTVIRGGVYDLTQWVTKHPGGKSAILRLCGTDGTAAFDGQHKGQGRPEDTLTTFKIGTLAP